MRAIQEVLSSDPRCFKVRQAIPFAISHTRITAVLNECLPECHPGIPQGFHFAQITCKKTRITVTSTKKDIFLTDVLLWMRHTTHSIVRIYGFSETSTAYVCREKTSEVKFTSHKSAPFTERQSQLRLNSLALNSRGFGEANATQLWKEVSLPHPHPPSVHLHSHLTAVCLSVCPSVLTLRTAYQINIPAIANQLPDA